MSLRKDNLHLKEERIVAFLCSYPVQTRESGVLGAEAVQVSDGTNLPNYEHWPESRQFLRVWLLGGEILDEVLEEVGEARSMLAKQALCLNWGWVLPQASPRMVSCSVRNEYYDVDVLEKWQRVVVKNEH